MKVFGGKAIKTNQIKPNYANISLESLHYAPYQRKPKGELVKAIANNFDWDLFGVISVSYRDGKYWIVDGGHRVAGLSLKDKSAKVLCCVWEGLSYEEECAKFLKFNSQRNSLNAAEKFHAKVEEGNPEAIDIVTIMKKFNFSYAGSNITNCDIIKPINAVEYIYSKYGSKVLNNTLGIIKSTWLGDKESLTCKVLKGMSTFLNEYQTINFTILRRALDGISPKDLEIEAIVKAGINKKRISLSGGQCKFYHICLAIRDLYNENAPKGKRIA